MRKLFFVFCFLFFVVTPVAFAQENESEPVVQAVLFYSPTCPHCHYVITEILIPMQEQYGEALQILGLSTQEEVGASLYQAAVVHYEIPESRRGVPLLIVADMLMVGSVEVEEQFPPIVEAGFAGEGIPWPDFPALFEVFPDLLTGVVGDEVPADTSTESEAAAIEEAEEVVPEEPVVEVEIVPEEGGVEEETAVTSPSQSTETANDSLDIAAADIANTEATKPSPDPVGMAVGGVVMVGMLLALGFALSRFMVRKVNTAVTLQQWAIPVISAIGLGIALYLGYVEVNHVDAVCGPVGECNIVQSSPYARLLGVPVAVWGVLNYLAILALWFWQQRTQGAGHQFAIWSLIILSVGGTFYSIFLTGLELFVIHAVCAWCLSSAIVTTILMFIIVVAFTKTSVSRQELLQV